jgi:hypothetical protein
VLDLSLERSEDGESQTDIEAHTDQAWTDSVVIAHQAIVLVDLCKAVSEAREVMCVLTLHLRLYHIDRVVAHSRAESSEHSRSEVDDHLSIRILLQELLGV